MHWPSFISLMFIGILPIVHSLYFSELYGLSWTLVYTVPEAQFQHLENPKLAFATATSNSDCLSQKVVQLDGIIS